MHSALPGAGTVCVMAKNNAMMAICIVLTAVLLSARSKKVGPAPWQLPMHFRINVSPRAGMVSESDMSNATMVT
jgi:hypothetical protein